MSFASLRLVEHVHGHIGWLAVLALAHPAILLRKPRRRATLAAFAGTLLTTVAAVMGATMYSGYRVRLKPALFAEAPAIAWAFERKEHLATAAMLLAWTGLAAHYASRGEPSRLSRLAHRAYVAAALSAGAAATIGVAVACQQSFD
jgi:hypothetical protein